MTKGKKHNDTRKKTQYQKKENTMTKERKHGEKRKKINMKTHRPHKGVGFMC